MDNDVDLVKIDQKKLDIVNKDEESVRQFIRQQRADGILIENCVNVKKLYTLAQKLKPFKTQHELIRLGPAHDGGYLVPNDFEGITACYSPGVEDRAYFEEALKNKFNIKSHLADFSVNGPPQGFEALSFTKKYLSCHNLGDSMTMEQWVLKSQNFDEFLNGEFILQMDIEGAEYEALLATPDYILERFRIIVMEIHWLNNWAKSCYYDIADGFLNKLLQHFIVVHVHPNNGGALMNFSGFEIPAAVEVTFLRKDRCKFISENRNIPHELDSPNNPERPDYDLPWGFR